MEEKTVKIKVPFDRWRVEEMQSYFEDMSAQGFHIKEMGNKKDEFETGEPEAVHYRIDIAKENYRGFRKEQLEYYTRAGWKHIGWIDGCHLFRFKGPQISSALPDPFDPTLVVKALKRKAILGLVMNLLLIPTAVVFIWSVFLNGKDSTEINYSGMIQAGALLLLLLQSWFQNMSIFHYARDLDDRLSGGETLRKNVPYEELARKYSFEKKTVIALTLFLFLLQAVPIFGVI